MTKSSHVMQQTFQSVLEDDWEIDIEKSSQQNSTKDLQLMMRLQLLEYSNWFSELQTHPHIIHAKSTQPDLIPDITSLHIKQWRAEIKLQEKAIAQSRINILNPEQEAQKPKLSTLTTTQIQKKLHLKLENKAQLNTVSPTFKTIITEINPEQLCTQICQKFQLNKNQKISFLIASNAWLKLHEWQRRNLSENKVSDKPQQLRMFLTGPGGTGKTHVIGAVSNVMGACGCEHCIRYLAPTGGTAKIINGMTVHKGLGIAIQKKSTGKTNSSIDQNDEHYTVTINIKKLSELQLNWKHVDVLLVDEIGSVGQQLLSEIDHALRIAKERPDEWFGGIIVIFAGDFHQHAPMSETALYQPISNSMRQDNSEIKKDLED